MDNWPPGPTQPGPVPDPGTALLHAFLRTGRPTLRCFEFSLPVAPGKEGGCFLRLCMVHQTYLPHAHAEAETQQMTWLVSTAALLPIVLLCMDIHGGILKWC